MNNGGFLEVIPEGGSITDYDRENMTLYMRLMDATDSDADFSEIMRILFDLDSMQEPDRCKRIYNAHLARARWMASVGYHRL